MQVMTAVLPDHPETVIEATDADLHAAIAGALERAACTWDELVTQGQSGRFDSIRARLAWIAISDLGDLAQHG
jgi:hypothetical protein